MFRVIPFLRTGRRAALVIAAVTLGACTDPSSIFDPSSGSTTPSTNTPPSSTTGRGRVLAGARNVHTLSIGPADNYVIVQGDGDTDLDCYLYDGAGRLVSSDTDLTDVCVLPAPGVGTHRLVIENLGSVYNDYTIWFEN